jgi:hypothetical protein
MIRFRTPNVVAAIVSLVYIIAQSFQSYVFTVLPEPGSTLEAFIQDSSSLNIWRSSILLLSFWGLIYLFLVLCANSFTRRPIATALAFVGLFIFCQIEILLRSVELFYVQIHLPGLYRATLIAADRHAIIGIVDGFHAVQSALYFPLLFSQFLGSVILACAFDYRSRVDWLLIAALSLNALRLVTRMAGMFLDVQALNDFSNQFYLIFVYLIFGLIAAWLLQQKGRMVER